VRAAAGLAGLSGCRGGQPDERIIAQGEHVGFCLVHQGCQLGDLGSDLIGDPGLRRGRLVLGLYLSRAITGSVPAVAARRVDRLRLLDVEFGDRLELVCQL